MSRPIARSRLLVGSTSPRKCAARITSPTVSVLSPVTKTARFHSASLFIARSDRFRKCYRGCSAGLTLQNYVGVRMPLSGEHATRVLFPATRREHLVAGSNAQSCRAFFDAEARREAERIAEGFRPALCAFAFKKTVKSACHSQIHATGGCLRRVAADCTRVACSTRNLPLAPAAILNTIASEDVRIAFPDPSAYRSRSFSK